MQPNVVNAENCMEYVEENLSYVNNDMVSIMYIQNNKCTTYLNFNGKKANCVLLVTGQKDSTSISGTLKLYDNTAKKNVANWSIFKKGFSYNGTKTATVKKGHSYTLSFSGKVYGKRSKTGESISASSSKKN